MYVQSMTIYYASGTPFLPYSERFILQRTNRESAGRTEIERGGIF